MLTIEALLAAIIIVGSGAFVAAVAAPGPAQSAPVRLDSLTKDAVAGLQLEDPLVLDRIVADAHACAAAGAATTACGDLRERLSSRLAPYLPAGARYTVAVSNGLGSATAGDEPEPTAQIATASLYVSPRWNLTLVIPELSCHDPSTPLNVHLLPLNAGAPAHARNVSLTSEFGNHTTHATAAPWWHATLEPSTGPAVTALSARSTSRAGTSAGHATLGGCAPGLPTAAVTAALADSRFALGGLTAAPGTVPGGAVQLHYDISPLETAVAGAAIRSVILEIHHPLTPTNGAPPVAHRADLGTAREGAATWNTPSWSPLGLHPATLRVALDLPVGDDVVTLEARLVTAIPLTLPGGHLPQQPFYRLAISTWHPEVR